MSRLFLALNVTLEDYERLQHAGSACLRGRWVKPGNLHLTLRFLGDGLSEDEVLKRLEGFSPAESVIALGGLGYFERHGVLYADVGPQSAAEALSDAVCSHLGVAPLDTRTFHVTLMRIKGITDAARFATFIKTWPSLRGNIGHDVLLMRSELHPEGARYTMLQRYEPC